MSGNAVIEICDVIRVWIEFRAPKKGELTWAVPANATPEEALEQVLAGREDWPAGEAGFGYRAFASTPEFENESCDRLCSECGTAVTTRCALHPDRPVHVRPNRIRNIVVHVEHVRTEPQLNNVLPHIKLL